MHVPERYRLIDSAHRGGDLPAARFERAARRLESRALAEVRVGGRRGIECAIDGFNRHRHIDSVYDTYVIEVGRFGDALIAQCKFEERRWRIAPHARLTPALRIGRARARLATREPAVDIGRAAGGRPIRGQILTGGPREHVAAPLDV